MEFEVIGFDEAIKKLDTSIYALPKKFSEIINKMGLSLQRGVKQKTPVGKSYKNHTGGQLRRSWFIKKVDDYTVRVYNNTEYAGYIEFGHRTRGGKSVVDGRFMLQRSLEELKMDNEVMEFFESIIENIW